MTRLLARLFTLTLLASFAPLVLAQALPTTSIDSIVAVVEEDVILRSELDLAMRNLRVRYADRAEQLPPENILEKQLLERLVIMRLQLQRAEEMGLRVGDVELDETMSRIAQQQGATLEQMRTQLAKDGIGYREFREQVRDEIITSRLQQNFVQSRVSVSEGEIDNALAARGDQQGQIRLGYLLVLLPDGATPEQIELARTKIEGVHDLIERGEMEFSAAAMRYSDHQTALEGGDMGWRSADEIPPLFVDALSSMKPGDVSRPLRGPSGFSLVKLIEQRDQAKEVVTEYSARSLLVRKSDVVSMEQARTKIGKLLERIRGGEVFADVAREASDDRITRAQGGEMGWFQLDAWGSGVATAINGLKDGEISEPFASDVGWHVIQRIGSREQDITRESERNRMRETLVRRKADEEFERYLRELRDEAYVDERLGGSGS